MEELTLKEQILEIISKKDKTSLREIFETIPSIDIAEALDDVKEIHVFMFIFRVISSEITADFFSELSQDCQEMILTAFSDKELVALLENSFADDIVDSIEDMPANLVIRILKVAPPDLRKDINTLLNYKDDTAGSIMTTEYFEMKNDLTVKEAIKQVRSHGKGSATIYTIFVKDYKRNLVGTVDLDDLIFAEDEVTLDEIMNRDFVTCKASDDQENVANMFKRYDLNAMAVVNKDDKLVGVITIDDVVDIIVEEANEDIAHLNQITDMETPYLKTPIWTLVLKCLPWILVLMVLQIGTAAITSGFDTLISQVAILAVFSPLILDAGGNSGGQTTTMIVRSLALDEFDKGDFKRVVWKELRVSLIIGGLVGLFAVGLTYFEMAVLGIGKFLPETTLKMDPYLAKFIISLLIGVTLFITMIISRLIGCMLPFLAKKIHIDPAVMCGPFTTTIVDVVSLLTYFLLWKYCFMSIIIAL